MNNLPTLLITIAIGALLVLGGLFYGGDLITRGTARGAAMAVASAGEQVSRSVYFFRTTYSRPTAWPPIDQLVYDGFLTAPPQLDSVVKPGTTAQIEPPYLFVAVIARQSVCEALNKMARVSVSIATAVNPRFQPFKQGCVLSSVSLAGSVAGADYVYFMLE